MTVFSALLLAGVLSALALAVGGAVGMRLTSRVVEQRQRVATEWSGITVSQMLQCIVTLMPLGAAVVDTHRDVVYLNERAKELGLVRDRQLDDQPGGPPGRRWVVKTSSSTCRRASGRPRVDPGYQCMGMPGC